MSEFILHI